MDNTALINDENINEIEIEIEQDHTLDPLPSNVSIFANLSQPIMQIGYILNPTGETNMVTVTNGKLHMMQNRTYYIPVATDVDSDLYSIKVPSEVADKFDVRFVKDRFACVVPLQHNIIIRDGQRICILTR